jgi:hypothetical protein
MSAIPSSTAAARLRLLAAQEERKKVREREEMQEAREVERELARIDEEERLAIQSKLAAVQLENRQREQARLAAEKKDQEQLAIRLGKRKAGVLEEPVAGGSGSSVRDCFRFESVFCINQCDDRWW